MPEETIHKELREDIREIRGLINETLKQTSELVARVGIQNGRVTNNEGDIKKLTTMMDSSQRTQTRLLVGIIVAFGGAIISMGLFIFFERTAAEDNLVEALKNTEIPVTLDIADLKELQEELQETNVELHGN